MGATLYDDLSDWYPLLTPVEDYADEAAAYGRLFRRSIEPAPLSLLELGAGAGHNAFHLKAQFACTLTDLSPAMLALSQRLNPECEHAVGDMRRLRLGRAFDAVLIHDAVMYMHSEADLRATATTAFLHTRPGGACLVAPDCVRETFRETTEVSEGSDGARSLRCLEWAWDPDPDDDTFQVEFSFLLREGSHVRSVHDRHVHGLFARDTWLRVFAAAGFRVECVGEPAPQHEAFLCRRPALI